MAKKKTIIEEQIPDGIEEEKIGWGDDDDVVSQLKVQYGIESIKIKVYKFTPGKTQPTFCFSDTTDNFREPEEQLQTSGFGGGKFVCVFFNNEGKRIYEKTYEIADKPLGTESRKDMSVADIQIAMLKEQSQMNRDLLMAVLGRGNNSSPLSEVATMWNIMKGTEGGGGLNSMIDLFSKGLELGANKSGDMDWKTALIQSVREIIPAVAQTAQVAMAAKTNGNVTGNGNYAEVSQVSPNAAVNPQVNEEYMLRAALEYVKPRILAGMPVSLALEWVVVNASDPQYQPLINAASTKTIDEMIKVDASIANEPYKSWITEFQKGLKEHFAQQLKDNEFDDNESD